MSAELQALFQGRSFQLLRRGRARYAPGVSVIEAIQRSAEFLARRGVDSPRLQVELLLAHLLKLPRLKLYLNFDRQLTGPQIEQLRTFIKRRGQREPLQHILGSTSFCGLEIAVNRQVLVPRPETEQLAELGWQFLSTLNLEPATALDFGTGSGCLAIALAVKCPSARVRALDISAEALDLARQNARTNDVAERIEFVHGNGLSALPAGARYDLIVANPPYVPTGEIPTLQPEVRDFDPHAALDGGTDGLDFYRRLATEAGAFLKPDGRLMCEFGDGQAASLVKLFSEQKWIVEEVRADYSARERVLVARQH